MIINPKISVIIPVYKVEKYLRRCVDSILNQTYKNFELLLVDDGSPDSSGKICDDYSKTDNRIKVIHKKNGGLSSARNAGIKASSGDYLNFVDSDDWLEFDCLEYLLELLTKNNADFSMAENIRDSSDVDFDSKLKKTPFEEKVFSQKDFLSLFFKINTQKNVQYAWAKLYKKKLFDNIKYPEGLTDEDVPATFNVILASNKIAYSTKIVYHYFVNPNSITESEFSNKKFDLLKVWDIVCKDAIETKNQWIIKNAFINRYRADFGILCNFILSKDLVNSQILYSDKIQASLENLKKHKKALLRSKIPFSRKILIVMFCFSFPFSMKLIRFIKHN